MTDTITLPRSVVERVLEALFMYKPMVTGVTFQHGLDAMQELRAALEQPQVQSGGIPPNWKLVPVEPTKEMMDAMIDNVSLVNFERGARNGYCAMIAAAPQPPVVEQPQVEQEPVAWLFQHEETGLTELVDVQQVEWGFEKNNPRWQKIGPVYTHPQPKRGPLTDEQINDHRLALAYDSEDLPDPWDFKQGVKAAERAHGIGGDE